MSGLYPNNNGTAAQLEKVSKTYIMGTQEVKALSGVSISFAKGSFWAILGPSGSGKSTMLNLLGCLDRPTSGRYILNGHDVSTLNDDHLSEMRLRHLGFIFQSFNRRLDNKFAELVEMFSGFGLRLFNESQTLKITIKLFLPFFFFHLFSHFFNYSIRVK